MTDQVKSVEDMADIVRGPQRTIGRAGTGDTGHMRAVPAADAPATAAQPSPTLGTGACRRSTRSKNA